MHPILLVVLSAAPVAVPLPGGEGGIGFDDLGYSAELGRVLAPAGRTGRLDLIDPKTNAVTSVEGFSADAKFGGGHGEGTTSAQSGQGLLFASDRGSREVVVVDPKQKKIVSRAALAGGPDYVRWVEPLKEVWVTEPRLESIERFTLDGNRLTRSGGLPVKGGPESLVIDAKRGRAYTHTWRDQTVVIDLKTHREVARWKNGCQGSRGIGLDEARGWLFVGCEEGKATALDVAHEGKLLGSVPAAKGVDIIAYDEKHRHLYVPGGDGAKLTFAQVEDSGALKVLGEVDTADDASCVTTDGAGHVFVCDPKHGRLLVFQDLYP